MRGTTLGTSTDKLYTLEVACDCPSGRRMLPIRVSNALRDYMDEIDPAPDMMLFQYRCSDCKGIKDVRARHLRSAVPSA